MKPFTPLSAAVCILLVIGIFVPAYADIYGSLHFYPTDFSVEAFFARDSNYYAVVKCDLANQAAIDSVGAPELPVLTYVYSLPQGVEVSGITVTNRQMEVLDSVEYLIYPIQTPMITRKGEPEPDFIPPGPIYSGSTFPAESYTVTCINPVAFSFGMGIATIQVMPVWYDIDQSKVWLYTDLAFTIHTTATTQTPRLATARSIFAQKYITDYLKGMVKNPSSVDANLPLPILSNYNYPVDPPDIDPEMVVVTSQIGGLTWYVNWKRNIKGMPTRLFTLENDVYPNFPGVDNSEKLRNFIISKYSDGALFVLLVGNMDYVPIRYVFTPNDHYVANFISDLYYAGLDGNWNTDGDGVWGEPDDNADIAADIFVGRVAATSDPIDIQTWTDKLVYYVDNPGEGDDSYLANVVFTTSDQMADDYHNQPVYIGSAFSSFFNLDTETLREQPSGGAPDPTSPFGEQVINYITNSPVGCYVNLNHGSPHDYSVSSHYSNNHDLSVVSDVDGVQGGPLMHGYIGDVQTSAHEYIQLSNSCDLGALDANYWPNPYPDCFAEKSLLLYGGCIAGTFNSRYGLVWDSYKLERYRVTQICGEYDQHILAIAHYNTLSHYANSYRDLVYSNNFFGDPSMRVWTDDPGLLAVEHPATAYRGFVQNLTITVKNSATQIGLSNVLVALVKGDEVYGRGLTDITGRVTIPIKPDTEGMLKIVADRGNFKSFIDSIFVDTYCEPAVAGDANGSGTANGIDVSFIVNYFKGGAHPPDSCMCVGETFLYHAADANGNCNFNGMDATYLNNYLKGTGPAPFFCPTCPMSRSLAGEDPAPALPAKIEETNR